ncbi:hypothetical protein G6F57_021379 [Rhizopus arrhizus]|nr:hypothetical protein G6F57_021379 [Rhizopus arrhizus]
MVRFDHHRLHGRRHHPRGSHHRRAASLRLHRRRAGGRQPGRQARTVAGPHRRPRLPGVLGRGQRRIGRRRRAAVQRGRHTGTPASRDRPGPRRHPRRPGGHPLRRKRTPAASPSGQRRRGHATGV